jgi:hypothetical protein
MGVGRVCSFFCNCAKILRDVVLGAFVFLLLVFALVEQHLKKCMQRRLFWVAFLVWGLLRLQVAARKDSKRLGKT